MAGARAGFDYSDAMAKERDALQRLVRRRNAGQAAVMRARIVLAADAEPRTTNRAIAARTGQPPERDSLAAALRGAPAGQPGGCAPQRSTAPGRRRGGRADTITLTTEEQPAGATRKRDALAGSAMGPHPLVAILILSPSPPNSHPFVRRSRKHHRHARPPEELPRSCSAVPPAPLGRTG